ncbi:MULTISPECIES: hypothetical protein [unclassified Anabaena]|uniref:hypothetical protein n=1 Tax=unclassified Anabaena TaxID=2619674 RepID=UPI0018D2BFD0|nr:MULTISPECIES: hypothetical protein [unclassified Anabaena]
MSNINKKRLDAIFAIATYAVGSGAASAVPTPGAEIPKQVILTASDILMYVSIWKTYFQDDVSSQGIVKMLTQLGLVTVGVTGTAYVAGKATTAILKEINNWTGPLGWGVTAVIAGSFTGLFGVMWALYCDYLYSQKIKSQESRVISY